MAGGIENNRKCTPDEPRSAKKGTDGASEKFQEVRDKRCEEPKPDGWSGPGNTRRSTAPGGLKTAGESPLGENRPGIKLAAADAPAAVENGSSPESADAQASKLLEAGQKSYGNRGILERLTGSETPAARAGGNLGEKLRQDGQAGNGDAVLNAMLTRSKTPQERREVAAGMVHALSKDGGRGGALVKTALTPSGRAMLERAAAELPKGSEERTRIESALKAAQLRADAPTGAPKHAGNITWIPGQSAQDAAFSDIEKNAGDAGRTDKRIGKYIGDQFADKFETGEDSVDGASKSALSQFDKTLAARGSPEERQNVARGVAEAYVSRIGSGRAATDKLLHAAQTPGGRALLERARDNLPQGDPARARVEAVLHASDLYNAPPGELDPASRDAAFRQIGAAFHGPGGNDFVKAPLGTLGELTGPDTSARKTENVLALVRSAPFKAASPEMRQQMLAAVKHHAGDTVFREGLETLVSNPALASPQQKAAAIQALDTFATQDSYQGGHFSVGEKDKRTALGNAAALITSPGFVSAGGEDRQAALAALNNHALEPSAAGQIAFRMNTDGFKAADGDTKKKWLAGWDKRSGDTLSSRGVEYSVDYHTFNGDKFEITGTRRADRIAQKVELTITYTGEHGIRTAAFLGTHKLDTSKPLDMRISPDGQSLALQEGVTIPLKHEVTESTQNGVTVRTHSFDGHKLTLLPEPGPEVMSDAQHPGSLPRYDLPTELAAAGLKVDGLAGTEFSGEKAGAASALDKLRKGGVNRQDAMERAARVNDAATAARQASAELRIWGNPEDHPPERAAKLKDAREKQEAALRASYTGSADDYAHARAEADRSLTDVAATAARNGGPLSQQRDLQRGLEGQISALEEKNPTGEEAKRRAQSYRVLGLTPGPDGKPVEPLSEQTQKRIDALRDGLARGDPAARARIAMLYAENQHKINNMAIIAMREQIPQDWQWPQWTFQLGG